MVSVKSLFTSVLAALPLASAYITNLAAPESAKAGTTIKATLTASIYIQNWDDFGIIWGLTPNHPVVGDELYIGQRIAYTPLFPDNVPKPGQFTVDVPIPKGFQTGDFKLYAAIPYLVGASGLTAIQSHVANITIEAA
ncbi:uncharacterized protein GGS25DRAFT_283873 [Hypoxylon fragiforme]|uniref:uncharacterized protein n=1 Tax=Hypoxylon fragiforme TaxID=63214 RepID=UPI0020C72B4A|nr:uncharacterized protein GGS25DRAFT_283873 [Hypoxylon fragiforme]KAI2608581.1 hypothetical protein GGS25DRAFT_283873 [Hypoxylon fragiforme]